MPFKPIPQPEWAARADTDFWKPYGRKRGFQTKSRMVKDQYNELLQNNETEAKAFAQKLATAENELSSIRAKAYIYLAKMAQTAGDLDQAVEYAIHCCKLGTHETADYQTYFACDEGAMMLVKLICDHNQLGRVAEAAEVVRQTPPTISSHSQSQRDLQTAGLLSLAGQQEEAVAIATQAFVEIDRSNERTKEGVMYAMLKYSTGSFGLDRVIFNLVQRGGAVRIVGLLDSKSAITPDKLQAKLLEDVYFKEVNYELQSDRLIIRLAEFDLDIRWSPDPTLIRQVTHRLAGFKEEERQQIPAPPAEPTTAFIVLGIGDDTSKPDVINPMINFVDVLDQFGDCIFFDRVGPLSKK